MDIEAILACPTLQQGQVNAIRFLPNTHIVIDDDIEPQPPKRSYKKQLTRDERLRVRVLFFDAGWSYNDIAKHTQYTHRQIQYACNNPVTPQRGNRQTQPAMKTPIRAQLDTWLRESTAHRLIPWREIHLVAPTPLQGYRESAYRTAMRLLGYQRKVRPRRIHLTPRHKRERVEFARMQLHIRPRPEDWEAVIFSDETWASNDPMWKQWITVNLDETSETWALLRRNPQGWMFASMFAGARKGPGHFWEKEWGGITVHKYIFYFLPLVRFFFNENQPHVTIFQQDNAPSHRAYITQNALQQMGIPVLKWPANSPDLNPIENV